MICRFVSLESFIKEKLISKVCNLHIRIYLKKLGKAIIVANATVWYERSDDVLQKNEEKNKNKENKIIKV
ncbi:MAG: hypothetical protein LBD84_01960 [Campylobacteraceae bacterium]|nr:hypothetical protein [Campylobacteraceae bacterium]